MKLTAIAALCAALASGAGAFYFTRDHYVAFIAENDDRQQKARRAAQERADAAAAFATTTSNLLVTQISTDYERKLNDAKSQADRDIAAARAGALRLRDRAATCGNQPSESATGPGAGVSADTGGAELSLPATEFLLSEAGRADEIVLRLNACEAVVRSDRDVLARLNVGEQ
ncbi:lysis protein [Burkholderia pseudomallei]|nr:lysis protein [Burkholderia pseudomallei]MBF3843889.1 lysis protein [Burkholderia pseudomallei]